MISYGVIDRIEGNIVILELECIDILFSRPEQFASKPTKMIEIKTSRFPINDIEEGQIFIVENDNSGIYDVLLRADLEENRRKELIHRINQS